MYLIDFFKSIGRKSNIPVIIYLILNVVIISMFMLMFSGGTTGGIIMAILVGIGIYIASLALALSPIGEAILRAQTGCKEITDPEVREFIEPIFNEIYAEARELDPTINPDVKIYMSDDDSINAFATGRQTVCVTRGIVNCDPIQLKGVLGHEFGHLAHKDTDMLQVINVGNLLVSGIIIFIRFCIIVGDIMFSIVGHVIGGDEGFLTVALSNFSRWMSLLLVAGLTKVWTWIGMLLCMKSSRGNEFEADAFSTRLGYGNALCDFFEQYVGNNPKGIYATVAASHPDKDLRIAHIREVQEEMLMNPDAFKPQIATNPVDFSAIKEKMGTVLSPMPVAAITGAMKKTRDTVKEKASSLPKMTRRAPGQSTVDEEPQVQAVPQGGRFVEPIDMPAPAVTEAPRPRVRFCTECGNRMESGEKFCPACGTRVEE